MSLVSSLWEMYSCWSSLETSSLIVRSTLAYNTCLGQVVLCAFKAGVLAVRPRDLFAKEWEKMKIGKGRKEEEG